MWVIGATITAGLAAATLVFLLGYQLILRYWPSPPPLPSPVTSDDLWGGVFERRRWFRRWGNPVQVVVRDPLKGKSILGLVVNRSQGGVAVLLDERHQPSTVLSLRPPDAQEDMPWVKVEVKHHRRAGRQWLIGCQFVEAPPWNVVVWLG
jgi:hypothetical protein